MKHRKLFVITLLSALSLAQATFAYEIQAKLDRAMVEYNNNNVGKAADLLTEVSDYLRGLKAAALNKLIPDAPEGWKVVSSSVSGGSLVGGSSQTKAEYTNGTEKVLLSYMTDNKLVGSMLSMLTQTSNTNPESMKMRNGYIYTFGNVEEVGQFVYNLYISENLVVSVKGETLTEDTAVKFIDKINMDSLKVEAEK